MSEARQEARDRSAQADRSAALRALYETHKDEVFGFLVTLTGDRERAADLLHESFVKVCESFDSYDRDRPFRPWLFQIVRNTACSAHRKKKTQPLGDDAAERARVSDRLLRELATREASAEARSALGALPEDTRSLLVLRHGLGLKLDEIATTLGVTERTVRNRLRAAGEEFTRAWLARRGGRS